MSTYRHRTREKSLGLRKPILVAPVLVVLFALVSTACQPIQARDTMDVAGAPSVSGMAQVNGTNLYYEMKGNGPPVIFVHGFTLDSRMWEQQFEQLSQHYKVIRFDWRGHGKSAGITEPFAPQADLKALMDHLDIDQTHLIGHSIGGAIVTHFALDFPDKVRSLTLIDALATGDPSPTELVPRLIQYVETAFSEGIDVGLQQWVADPLFASANALPSVQTALSNIVEGHASLGEGAAFVNLQNILFEPPAYERLQEVAIPTLVIVGETDLDEFHAMAHSLSTEIDHAQSLVIAGAGHMAPMENPDDVTNALAEFLAASSVPGVTDEEIILGVHTPLTGPLAELSEIAKATKAYFDYINDTEGSVHGRKITYLLGDDQYTPSMTVDVVNQLVEEEGIFALVGGVGTPTHMQVVDTLQAAGIPDLFVVGGSPEWVRDPAARPTVFGSVSNYIAEGVVLGRYLAENYAGQKLGLLFQNDGFGQSGIDGIKRGVGEALTIVAEESYEVGPPDLSAQVEQLHDAGAEIVAAFALPPFLAAAIAHARTDLGWDVPFVTGGPGGDAALMAPEMAEGLVSIGWQPNSAETDHPGVAAHLQILHTYSDLDQATSGTLYGQYIGELTVEILQRAGRELTRDGLIATAESIRGFLCSVCLYPITMSATDHRPIDTLFLMRFDGEQWVFFGDGYSMEGVLPDDLRADTIQPVPSPYGEN